MELRLFEASHAFAAACFRRNSFRFLVFVRPGLAAKGPRLKALFCWGSGALSLVHSSGVIVTGVVGLLVRGENLSGLALAHLDGRLKFAVLDMEAHGVEFRHGTDGVEL